MIPYGRQSVDEEDVAAVVEVLRSDWLTQGPKVAEFERALAAYCGARHAVLFANGTLALQGAYFAAGLKAGDEILTSPLTFAATANAALWLGAKPVFADVEPATGNLDSAEAERHLSAKTKVLAPVDYGGRPADLDAFLALARSRGLVVVEDACHALGASYQGRKIGSVAHMSVFSFHPVKSITTGEGGAVLTDDEGYAARLRSFAVHGITGRHPDWRYEIGHLGLNARMTDIQCALGLSQLKKLDRFVARRSEIAADYAERLKDLDEWLELPPLAPARGSAWHLYPVRLRLDRLAATRAEVFAALRAGGVGTQVHYIPVYHHPLYRGLGYRGTLCPKAEAFYEAELSLPIFPALTGKDLDRVAQTLRGALSGGARKGKRAAGR